MHMLVAAVPLLLLLAGCAGPADMPDEAGDQLPDGSGGEDDAVDPGTGTGGHGFAPQEGHDAVRDPEAPGIIVEGDLVPCEAGFCIDAQARNDGQATYHTSSICVSPWADRMEKDAKAVAHREPMAHCLAFGTQPFGPGDALDASFSWNGTVWNDATAVYEPAPGGAYEWIVSFQLYDEADGGGMHELEIRFTVVVGET